jgi:CubicO group peptidase (beta-lactamase class C family)
MSFRHLADMTSGYSRAEAPGTHWAYNDLAINLYRHLMVEVLGEPLNDAALKRLAALQFQDGDLFGSRDGAGVNTSPRDFARLGWFWMNHGSWNGRQLLPREYSEKHMTPEGNEVMLIVPSWRLVVAARGHWGGVRLEKTRLLADAVLQP